MNKKVVLITGSNGGIGQEICKKFKDKNWCVIGTSLSDDEHNQSIDRYIKCDLTNSESIKDLVNTIRINEKRLDCIINNAALQICKPIWDMEEYEWDMTFSCNLKSIFLFVKYGLDLLKEVKGNIINIGSVHSINTSNKIATYACTKAAISGLTRNLAIELGQFGIRVNCISPGAVDTPMLRSGLTRGHIDGVNENELINNLGKKHLLSRVGQPKEIANFIYFVGDSDNGEFINGANLIIDGGATIQLSTE
jgi:NAD(P)-dependent dehydrogenase (short-subunit alcohol dehydrogenase family)